jgi:hypothetical protein
MRKFGQWEVEEAVAYAGAGGAVVVSQGIDCDWVIVGGESGPNARPLNVGWVRSLVWQCQKAGVPVFVKQMGPSYYEDRAGGDRMRVCLNDSKGGDISEFPEDLRVRELPITSCSYSPKDNTHDK